MTVRVQREMLGMTLAQIEVLIDIDTTMLSRIETGKATPSMDHFCRLCELFNLKPARFFTTTK